jgi:RimJ/RimL family protein N-acetyltransferase
MKNLLFHHDAQVAEWAFDKFNFQPTRYDLALGIMDDGVIVGAAIWHAYNGCDIELSYYGPVDLGIARKLARVAVGHLGVSRVTARTARNNKKITRGIRKIGFEYEGIRKYGHGDQDSVMYGLYGKKLARLAGRMMQ